MLNNTPNVNNAEYSTQYFGPHFTRLQKSVTRIIRIDKKCILSNYSLNVLTKKQIVNL
jgi:hypothetical protein